MRDVIVVGAGGGGPVVAKELAERGLDVLLLEAGERSEDPASTWSRFENDSTNPVTGYLRFGPADRSKPPWFRETDGVILQVAGVGGTTTHYYGNSPRAMPGAFAGYEGADRAAYDRAHEFPFTYRSLIPYYEWVEHTLPVQTAAMGTKEEVFFRAAEEAGLTHQTGKDIVVDSFRPQENAILQPKGTAGRTTDPAALVYPRAQGCTLCGSCLQGCVQPAMAPPNLRAKRSTDASYVPMALTADRWAPGGRAVTLVTDAFATRVHTERGGADPRANAVTWRVGGTGEEVTEEARVVVLAAGCIETPRLWLNSGLPDPNGWVGAGCTTHYLDLVFGLMPHSIESSKGAGSAARADFPGRGSLEHAGAFGGPGLMAGLLSIGEAGINGLFDNGLPATAGADGVGAHFGNELKAAIADIDRIMYVFPLTDDHVERQNRVSISTLFPPDEHGPVAKLHLAGRNRSPRTIANREYLAEQSVRIVRAAGANKVWRLNMPELVLHVHSTMRMGASEADSVLDHTAESRWVKGLYVADNSALANGVGGPNPTLTTQALATWTAEHIFGKHFGGDPWVAGGSPVSSIDDVVTRAVLDLQPT